MIIFKKVFLYLCVYAAFVAAIAVLTTPAHAGEIEYDFSYTEMQHSWRGPSNVGDFEGPMKSIGATYWNSGNFGLRVAIGDAGFLESTGGQYSRLHIKMDRLVSIELLYRLNISKETYLFGGIGQYYIPASAYTVNDALVNDDRDDDTGYLFGVGWRFNKHISIAYRFTRYSTITEAPYDEWTRGHGIHLVFTF